MDSSRYETNGNATSVSFIVKTSNQRIDDQTVMCKLDWTVARLKDHLAQVYPTKPPRQEQRIIFFGKLLEDSLVLRDIVRFESHKDNGPLVVHLVCGDNTTLSSPKTTNPSVDVDDQTTRYLTAESRPEQSVALQQYYSQLNRHQVAWMQQAYAHYLTRYIQIMAAQGIQVEGDPTYMQPLDVNTRSTENTYINATTFPEIPNNGDENDVPHGQEHAAVGGALAVQQQVEDPNNVANNQNVPVNEAAPINRDWLDIFDMLSRIVVLSSIVIFYSTPSRFFIVTFLGFAIYLIQGGFFRGQQVLLGDNNNAGVGGDNNNQIRNNEAIPPDDPTLARARQAPRVATVPSGEQQQAEATRTNLNEENERPGAWAFTWTFFSSFFASLIPDQPNVI